MSCAIEIKDLVLEIGKPGILIPVPGLTTDETAGVLTAILKTVDQASDVISDNGLGTYGLSIADLQLTGVVKKGLSLVTEADALAGILSDPSVFTGNYDVTDVDDILNNEGLQRELINDVMVKNVKDLGLQGLLKGLEIAALIAGIAALAAKFSIADIKQHFANLLSGVTNLLDDIMTELSDLASYAALMIATKSADLLSFVKGIGSSVSLPVLEVGTIEIPDINANVDSIVGSLKIQSAGDIEAAAQAATKLSVETTGITDLASDFSADLIPLPAIPTQADVIALAPKPPVNIEDL